MDVKDSLSIAGLDHGYPSVFAMLDEEGRVMYVSDDSYDTGRMLEEQAGHDASYRVVQKSVFGFSCILLMTHSSYRQFVMSWAKDLLLIVLVIVLTILLTVLFLYRLIYKPLRMFSEEVETICEGDLTPSTQIFDIREFDDLFVKIEEMKLRITQLMDDMHRSDNEKHRLKVDNLYYQINPHFLLNALNSLHWMAAVSGQENIVQYVHHLNSILSYSLGKTREMITFRSELRVAELYVAFQQARYDFDFTRDVEEGSYLDHPCARLILQPMLENAICHNMNEFGKLWLSMKLDKADTVRIEIIDDGVGMAELPEAGMPLGDANFKKGIGLKYLQYTLEANYGNCFSALIYPAQPSGVMIVLLLPLT